MGEFAKLVHEMLEENTQEAAVLAARIADEEAVMAEWEADAISDKARRHYEAMMLLQGLQDLVHDRVTEAEGAADLRARLATVLDEIRVSHIDDTLRVDFALVGEKSRWDPDSVAERSRGAAVFAHAVPDPAPALLGDNVQSSLFMW